MLWGAITGNYDASTEWGREGEDRTVCVAGTTMSGTRRPGREPTSGESDDGGEFPVDPGDEGTDGVVVVTVVRDLVETADGPVEYDWVIQHTRREYRMRHETVVETAERLVDRGVLRKVRADRLTLA